LAGVDRITLDEDGRIKCVYLYAENKNPVSNKNYWNEYFAKIRMLSALKVPGPKSKYKFNAAS